MLGSSTTAVLFDTNPSPPRAEKKNAYSTPWRLGVVLVLLGVLTAAITASGVLFGIMFVGGKEGIGLTEHTSAVDTSKPFYMYLQRTQWSMQHTKNPMSVALYYGWAWLTWVPGIKGPLFAWAVVSVAVLPEAAWEVKEKHSAETERVLRGRTNGSYIAETEAFLYESVGDSTNDLLAAFVGGLVALVLIRALLWERMPTVTLALRRGAWLYLPPVFWTVVYVLLQIAVILNSWFGIMRKDFTHADGSQTVRYLGGYWIAFSNEIALKTILCLMDFATVTAQLHREAALAWEHGGSGEAVIVSTAAYSSHGTVLLFYCIDTLASATLHLFTLNLIWYTFPLTLLGCLCVVVFAVTFALLRFFTA